MMLSIDIQLHEGALAEARSTDNSSPAGWFSLTALRHCHAIGRILVYPYLPGGRSVLRELTHGEFPEIADVPSAEVILGTVARPYRRTGLRELLYTLALDTAQAAGIQRVHCLARPITEEANCLMRMGFAPQMRCRLYTSLRGEADLFTGLTIDIFQNWERIDAERSSYVDQLRLFGYEAYFACPALNTLAETNMEASLV